MGRFIIIHLIRSDMTKKVFRIFKSNNHFNSLMGNSFSESKRNIKWEHRISKRKSVPWLRLRHITERNSG